MTQPWRIPTQQLITYPGNVKGQRPTTPLTYEAIDDAPSPLDIQGVVFTPQYLYPAVPGTTVEWTSGGPQDIDDAQPTTFADDDTTYMELVSAAGALAIHLFKKTLLFPIPAGQVVTSVLLSGRFRRVSGASATVTGRLRINGTTYNAGTLMSLTSPGVSYASATITMTTSPATSANWTLAEVREMEMGAGIDPDGAGTYRCTQLFLTVNYGGPIAG